MKEIIERSIKNSIRNEYSIKPRKCVVVAKHGSNYCTVIPYEQWEAGETYFGYKQGEDIDKDAVEYLSKTGYVNSEDVDFNSITFDFITNVEYSQAAIPAIGSVVYVLEDQYGTPVVIQSMTPSGSIITFQDGDKPTADLEQLSNAVMKKLFTTNGAAFKDGTSQFQINDYGVFGFGLKYFQITIKDKKSDFEMFENKMSLRVGKDGKIFIGSTEEVAVKEWYDTTDTKVEEVKITAKESPNLINKKGLFNRYHDGLSFMAGEIDNKDYEQYKNFIGYRLLTRNKDISFTGYWSMKKVENLYKDRRQTKLLNSNAFITEKSNTLLNFGVKLTNLTVQSLIKKIEKKEFYTTTMLNLHLLTNINKNIKEVYNNSFYRTPNEVDTSYLQSIFNKLIPIFEANYDYNIFRYEYIQHLENLIQVIIQQKVYLITEKSDLTKGNFNNTIEQLLDKFQNMLEIYVYKNLYSLYNNNSGVKPNIPTLDRVDTTLNGRTRDQIVIILNDNLKIISNLLKKLRIIVQDEMKLTTTKIVSIESFKQKSSKVKLSINTILNSISEKEETIAELLKNVVQKLSVPVVQGNPILDPATSANYLQTITQLTDDIKKDKDNIDSLFSKEPFEYQHPKDEDVTDLTINEQGTLTE